MGFLNFLFGSITDGTTEYLEVTAYVRDEQLDFFWNDGENCDLVRVNSYFGDHSETAIREYIAEMMELTSGIDLIKVVYLQRRKNGDFRSNRGARRGG